MRAYERLLNYVRVWTTSDPNSGLHPSTFRQFALAKQLAQELKDLGVENAETDQHCYVYAFIPATAGCENAPAVGFISHMDTSPEASGENVNPILHENYDGEAVKLPKNGLVISPEKFPFLRGMKGQTLITADGSTLLGADDKAGVSEIMTMVERLLKEKRPHGKICIGFTPDEEIGEGADFFDVKKFGADFAYTMDGGDAGHIEYENFNAAAAVVKIHGISVHPGTAKGVMVNASNVAMEFHMALPHFDRPEHTEGYEGFFHLTQMYGDVTEAKLGYIVRDHDFVLFNKRKQMMLQIADELNTKYGEGTVEVELKDSYNNMLEQIQPHFHLIENARLAAERAGVKPVDIAIRGGTDGARLSYMGLPCPNLGMGAFNFHGPLECTSIEKLDQCVEILLNLVELYSKPL